MLSLVTDCNFQDGQGVELPKPSVAGLPVIPPDKRTSLCLRAPQSNTNETNIDDGKWQRSYVDLRKEQVAPLWAI